MQNSSQRGTETTQTHSETWSLTYVSHLRFLYPITLRTYDLTATLIAPLPANTIPEQCCDRKTQKNILRKKTVDRRVLYQIRFGKLLTHIIYWEFVN